MNENKDAKTVLVIHEIPEIAEVVRLILAPGGYTVVAALEGCKGLEVMEELKPDLVLLDHLLPDMNGFEVFQRIKADENLKNIPLVFLIPKGKPPDFCDSITQPFAPEDLLRAVARALGESEIGNKTMDWGEE